MPKTFSSSAQQQSGPGGAADSLARLLASWGSRLADLGAARGGWPGLWAAPSLAPGAEGASAAAAAARRRPLLPSLCLQLPLRPHCNRCPSTLRRFFGGFGGFNFGFGQQEEEAPKGHAVRLDLEVSLRDLYLGTHVKARGLGGCWVGAGSAGGQVCGCTWART